MLQTFQILQGRLIIHIDMLISNFSVTTKLIKILNEIVSITGAYISFIIILDFCKKSYYISRTLYFIISLNFRTNTHLYLNRHYIFRCVDYRSKYFIFYS
jgi:hypothetical protein